MSTPFIGFGDDTLSKLPEVKRGDSIKCPRCKEQHVLEGTTSREGRIDLLLTYQCSGKSFVAAVSGHLIVGQEPDASGEI